ncbi:MAG TPA: macrolide ABC transporter ATP-binding protein [Clostridiales bacterium]|nr:macrolide ABC transporter ATP-binding protein [Clostridiales bacterium]
MPSAETLVRLERAEKTYGTDVKIRALKPTDLEFRRGELVVVLGPSGSGKTTLLNLIGGLDRPSAGRVLVDGVSLGSLDPDALADFRRDKVGFVFQFFNLIPSLTARENVELAAELSGTADRIDPILEAVGLADRAGHLPGQLSGGEQQRVAIARALVKDPPLLLCDEPTGAVDFETGKAILGLLQEAVQRRGKTVLIVTHNSALAAMATRLIRLKDGAVASDEKRPSPSPAAELVW